MRGKRQWAARKMILRSSLSTKQKEKEKKMKTKNVVIGGCLLLRVFFFFSFGAAQFPTKWDRNSLIIICIHLPYIRFRYYLPRGRASDRPIVAIVDIERAV